MSAEPASAACALDELAAGLPSPRLGFGAYPCGPGCIVRSGARGGGSSAPGKKIMSLSPTPKFKVGGGKVELLMHRDGMIDR
eukprot:scaffold76122_cov54-Phaeocystis_antarctica.AAC.2